MSRQVIAVALLLANCTPRDEGNTGGTPGETSSAAQTVQVVPVVSRKADTSTHLEGELSPYEAVSLFSKVGGFVSRVDVDRGSVVKNGQVLIVISAPELAAQRAEAEAKLEAARSTLEHSKAAAQTPGVIAGHELELQEAAVHADESRVQSLRSLEQYLVVRAPFDGVITERDVHPGAFVGPATGERNPMLRLEQVERLRLTVAVPERFVGEVSEGTTAAFAVSAWPNAKFSAVAKRISHSVDPRTRTMAVELDVDNSDGRLTSGMFVDVEWPLKRSADTLWVPTTAVVQSTERTFVVRVHDGSIEQIPVQRGRVTANLAEVFGAIQAGDLVARRGSEELRPGMRVETRAAPAPAPSGSAR